MKLSIKVQVNREQLLAKVKENRERHATEYAEAVRGWCRKVYEAAEQVMALANSGELRSLDKLTRLHRPKTYLKDYDRVIATLELATDETLELNDADADCLIADNWQWKHEWTASNLDYTRH
jgi:hypothetical protein